MFASLSCVVASFVTHPTQNVARHTREWTKQSAGKGVRGCAQVVHSLLAWLGERFRELSRNEISLDWMSAHNDKLFIGMAICHDIHMKG